jgi:hypothetical protein
LAPPVGRSPNLAAKLIFIEVIVTSATLMERNLRAKFRHERRLAAGEGAADHMRHTVHALSATDTVAPTPIQAGASVRINESHAVAVPGPSEGEWTAPPGIPSPGTPSPTVPAPAAAVPIPMSGPTPTRRTASSSSDHDWAAAAGLSLEDAEIPASRVRAFHQRVNEFARVYVSLQADGSEDDLSYIKLINYGQQVGTPNMPRTPVKYAKYQCKPNQVQILDAARRGGSVSERAEMKPFGGTRDEDIGRVSSEPRQSSHSSPPPPAGVNLARRFPTRSDLFSPSNMQVVTNRMHGYLRMRIAQFLTVIHPAPHTIYLTRHGQSTYNVLGKIGGNPPLSAAGEEYARRLGEWVEGAVCYQQAGKLDSLTRARLWTSSLQRTILTALHIPHPIISNADLGALRKGGGGGAR